MLVAELNWLPKSLFKGITYPKVLLEEPECQRYGGYYTEGTNILVAVDTETVESTIAHEFKHYLQYIEGKKLKSLNWNLLSSKYGYEKGIQKYFSSSWSELDALIFEYKVSKNWLNEWWLKKLVLNR